ncbi:hypothetical protein V9K67_16815, partial [Paraflavisolibacter sp. H34]|uniref:hypothetical protein n=1 Tax=Huijunlia imazamoxiresistens TaxID=3127457 RepID=UPI0030179AA8
TSAFRLRGAKVTAFISTGQIFFQVLTFLFHFCSTLSKEPPLFRLAGRKDKSSAILCQLLFQKTCRTPQKLAFFFRAGG